MQDPGALDADGFVHAALFYRTPAEFTAGVLPYVAAGVAARELVMVASQGRNLQLLRTQLDGLGGRVAFTDLTSIGPNPGRLLGWMRQVNGQDHGQPIRYVHEAVANQLCDLVEIRTGRNGTQIRLHMRLPA